MTFALKGSISFSMTFSLPDATSVELHRKLVSAALREVIGLERLHGLPAEKVVQNYYSSLPFHVQLLLVHETRSAWRLSLQVTMLRLLVMTLTV